MEQVEHTEDVVGIGYFNQPFFHIRDIFILIAQMCHTRKSLVNLMCVCKRYKTIIEEHILKKTIAPIGLLNACSNDLTQYYEKWSRILDWNPTINENDALRISILNGSVGIVKYLLNDNRVIEAEKEFHIMDELSIFMSSNVRLNISNTKIKDLHNTRYEILQCLINANVYINYSHCITLVLINGPLYEDLLLLLLENAKDVTIVESNLKKIIEYNFIKAYKLLCVYSRCRSNTFNEDSIKAAAMYNNCNFIDVIFDEYDNDKKIQLFDVYSRFTPSIIKRMTDIVFTSGNHGVKFIEKYIERSQININYEFILSKIHVRNEILLYLISNFMEKLNKQELMSLFKKALEINKINVAEELYKHIDITLNIGIIVLKPSILSNIEQYHMRLNLMLMVLNDNRIEPSNLEKWADQGIEYKKHYDIVLEVKMLLIQIQKSNLIVDRKRVKGYFNILRIAIDKWINSINTEAWDPAEYADKLITNEILRISAEEYKIELVKKEEEKYLLKQIEILSEYEKEQKNIQRYYDEFHGKHDKYIVDDDDKYFDEALNTEDNTSSEDIETDCETNETDLE